jgi:hypothetical protein
LCPFSPPQKTAFVRFPSPALHSASVRHGPCEAAFPAATPPLTRPREAAHHRGLLGRKGEQVELDRSTSIKVTKAESRTGITSMRRDDEDENAQVASGSPMFVAKLARQVAQFCKSDQ